MDRHSDTGDNWCPTRGGSSGDGERGTQEDGPAEDIVGVGTRGRDKMEGHTRARRPDRCLGQDSGDLGEL